MTEYGDIESQGLLNPPDRDHVCFDTSCKRCEDNWCPLEECDYEPKCNC